MCQKQVLLPSCTMSPTSPTLMFLTTDVGCCPGQMMC